MNVHQKRLIASIVPGNLLRRLYATSKIGAIQLEGIKLIYIPIPKAANRSVKTALAKKVDKHYSISAHKANWDFISLSKVDSSQHFSFSFVRNPLNRLLSCYLQKVKMKHFFKNFWKYGNLVNANMSFEDFVDFVINTPDYLADRHFKSQHLFLQKDGKIIVDFIGKVENMVEDWKFLSSEFDLPPIPHLNKSNQGHFNEYYTQKLAVRVAKHYTKDIELFKYRTEVELQISSLQI